MLRLSRIDTPVGRMALLHDADGRLWLAEFAGDDDARLHTSVNRFHLGPIAAGEVPVPDYLGQAFADYFAGQLHALESLPTGVVGSALERAVWGELRRIPAGETRSYGEVARTLGGAASGRGVNARAVGGANGRNPLAIVVPCHRVIGADGKLTGYAGGLWRKEWLLRHEGWRPAEPGLL